MRELGSERWQVELAIPKNVGQSIRNQRNVETREPVVLGVRAALCSVRDRLCAEQACHSVRQDRRRLSHMSHEEHDHLVESGQNRRDRHGELVLRQAVSTSVRSEGLRA